MTTITRAVEAHVDDMSPRHLATVLWSFAKLGQHPGGSLMRALTERITVTLVDMEPQVCM